jgi:hypothetical protein
LTPTRLRQIADRVEQVCIEKRILTEKQAVACDGCKRDARDLRDFAEWAQRKFGCGEIDYERTDARATKVVGI